MNVESDCIYSITFFITKMTTMESKLSRRNNLLYDNCTDLLSTDWWV